MPGKHSTSELPARLMPPYFVRRSSWPGEKTAIKTFIAPAQHVAKTVGVAWMEHCVGPMLVAWQRQHIQVWMCG